MAASSGASRTSGRPSAAATAATVMSSWVGPTPPEVNTQPARARSAFTAPAISSVRSATTWMASSRTPSSRSRRAAQGPFSSCTLAERTSFPTTTRAADGSHHRILSTSARTAAATASTRRLAVHLHDALPAARRCAMARS